MSTYLCKHGLPVATDEDMRAYMTDPDRESCRRRGDCDCPICSRVCWSGKCAMEKRELERRR